MQTLTNQTESMGDGLQLFRECGGRGREGLKWGAEPSEGSGLQNYFNMETVGAVSAPTFQLWIMLILPVVARELKAEMKDAKR